MSEQTHTGRTMNRQFDATRKSVLSEYPWAFAIRFSDLEVADDCPFKHGMRGYKWPEDAVAIWDVFFGADRIEETKYLVEDRYIYTNFAFPAVEYSLDIPFEQWDIATKEALTHRLAADACAKLLRSEELAQTHLQKYISFGVLAKRNTRNERRLDVQASGSYIRVRRANSFGRRLNNHPGFRP